MVILRVLRRHPTCLPHLDRPNNASSQVQSLVNMQLLELFEEHGIRLMTPTNIQINRQEAR